MLLLLSFSCPSFSCPVCFIILFYYCIGKFCCVVVAFFFNPSVNLHQVEGSFLVNGLDVSKLLGKIAWTSVRVYKIALQINQKRPSICTTLNLNLCQHLQHLTPWFKQTRCLQKITLARWYGNNFFVGLLQTMTFT